MSSDGIPIDPQDFPSFIQQSVLVTHITIAGLAWYAYEYLLTLPLEVEVIWKSKPNITIILFLINRYAFIFTWALGVVSDSIITHATVCIIIAGAEIVTNLLSVISVSGIFILRTYAICGQNKWILGSLSLLSLSRLGLSIRFAVDQTAQNGTVLIPRVDRLGNCVPLESLKLAAIEIVLTVAFDAMVFIITLSRTWTLSRRAKAAGVEATLNELLLRDGSLYFGLLSIITILEAITIFDTNLPLFLSVIVQLGFPLEVILANRLVLNLRTHSHSHDLPNPTTKTDMFFRQAYGGSRIDGRFQTAIDSVLGNIGAPLRVGNEPGDRDEDVLEVPNSNGERERYNNTEDGVDPLSLERTRSRSEQETVNGGEISEFQVWTRA